MFDEGKDPASHGETLPTPRRRLPVPGVFGAIALLTIVIIVCVSHRPLSALEKSFVGEWRFATLDEPVTTRQISLHPDRTFELADGAKNRGRGTWEAVQGSIELAMETDEKTTVFSIEVFGTATKFVETFWILEVTGSRVRLRSAQNDELTWVRVE